MMNLGPLMCRLNKIEPESNGKFYILGYG